MMANDLITQKRVLPDDTTIEKAAKLLPLANYVPHGTYPRDLARNLVILEQIAPLLINSKHYRDLTSDFTRATGVSPQVFCQLAFAASAKYLAAKQHPESSFVLRLSNLGHESVPKEDIAAFFSKSSIRITDLLALARKHHAEPADFIIFQRYPLIQGGPEGYVCPDPGFLLDKLGKSLYWTLHAAQPPDMRLGLLAYWSLLIEHYVHWLFENVYRGKGRILQSPCFADSAEVADIIILEGPCLVLIEVKASILTTAAKYSFSANTLRDELHLKAITGENGERKGVAQLHNSLRRFLNGDDIEGVDRKEVKYIYPVLAFLDHSFTSPYLNDYYNEHFDRDGLRVKAKRAIASVFSITINDLENSLPYTAEHSLSEILDSYSIRNRNLRPEEKQFRIPILDGKKPGIDVARERFNKFGEEFHASRFPDVPFPGHNPA